MKEPNQKKTRVALLGGSFDPPTISHIQIACAVYNSFENIDEVWISPCGDGRCDKKLRTHSSHRLKMLETIKSELITPNIPIYIDKTEANKGDYIPTYFFLKEMEKTHSDKEFIFCIGTDLISTLYYWENYLQLLDEFEFIIISRESYPLKLNDPNLFFPKRFQVLELNFPGSSTQIRNILYSKASKKINYGINGLTTPGVIKYIQENNLYSILSK